MSKQFVLPILFATVFAACATDESELVDVSQDPKADQYTSIPQAGIYTFDEYLGGAAQNGDVVALSLTPSRTFKAAVQDEWQGNTSHTGTFKLYRNSAGSVFYIDLIEGSRATRFEYYMDPVEISNIWLRNAQAQHWYGLRFNGNDCTSAGCAAGETCTSCWGENVCMASGTSC